MATFDPVGISFDNANKYRTELDNAQKRQDAVLGQTLAVAGQQDRRNEFGASMAQRAAEQAQQSRQFDIVQHLRSQQFELDKAQSFAQMAAVNSAQELRALEIGQKVQQINEAPMRQAAMMEINGIVSQAKSLEELNAARGKLSPEIYRFVPQDQVDQAFLTGGKLLADTQTAQLLQKTELQRQNDFNEFLKLGGNPEAVMQDGKVNATALYSALGPLQNQQLQRTTDITTESRLRVAQEQARGRIEAAKARIDSSKLAEADKIRVNALFKQAQAAQAAFNPEGAAQFIAQAEAILEGTGSLTAPSTTDGIAPAGAILTEEDRRAIDWANANPTDPRAAKIKKKLGLQ